MMNKNNKKTIKFKGRIVNFNADFQSPKSDIKGPHQIWYPKFKTDVVNAVKHLQGRKLLIRSGIQVINNDIVDGRNSVVINLSGLEKVAVKEMEVKAEAGTTAKLLGDYLIENNLVLPISDNENKSIASNLLFEEPSYLMRSLGPLSDYVTSINAVKLNGKTINFYPKDDSSCLDQYLVTNSILTKVNFKSVSANSLWMFRKVFSYLSKEQFLAITKALFIKDASFANTDLVLETYNGLYDIPFIRITALGASIEGKQAVTKHINTILAELLDDLDLDIVEEMANGAEVLEKMLSSETGPSFDPVIDTARFHSVYDLGGEFDDFLTEHSTKLHEGVAFKDDNDGKIKKDEYLTTRIQINRENQIEIVYYTHTLKSSIEPPVSHRKFTKSASGDFSKSFVDNNAFSEVIELEQKRIPDFEGKVYASNNWGYNSSIKQYATSSYPKKEMRPYMVVYPINERDVKAVLKFAKAKNKKIVARSGGHQYTGKSSRGKNTIVVSMDAFDMLKTSDTFAEVGPAVKLTTLARKFKCLGITVPHGECPYVAIGGHAQTGGYGHFLRCFGILIDYIHGFDIILADCRKITVTRPSAGSSITTFNDKLFWAVLGGNAGSFGIVTKYKIAIIKDSKHPNSFAFSATRKFKKELFLELMKEAQEWTKGVENETLPKDMDFMMTAASRGRSPFPVLLVELTHSNISRIGNVDSNMPTAFKSVITKASKGAKFWERWIMKSKHEHLSDLSDSFVRRWPATTLDGREFRNPYKKRVNCTTKSLTDKFITGFVNLIEKVINREKGIQLIFQMSIGGGEYNTAKYANISSIPHRDYTYCFVFDLFYRKGFEKKACELQKEMQALIDTHYNDGNELRVFWGSFGDTQIEKTEIREMYYPDLKVYEKLQEIKKEVDLKDLFHTSLTVKRPN